MLASNRAFYAEDDRIIDPKDLGENFYSTDAFSDQLLRYLQDRASDKENKAKPFFAYLAFSAPHWPLQAPEEEIQKYRGMYDDGPKALCQQRIERLKQQRLVPEHAIAHDVIAVGGRMLSQDWDTLKKEEKQFSSRTMEIYAAMVHRMDMQIDRVLEYLQKTDELKDTFVLFMSDNGAEGTLLEAVPIVEEDIFEHIAKYYDNSLSNLGRKDSYAWYGPHWASAATAPSRLYKYFSSEGGIRVPCLLNYPPLTARRGSIDHSFATVMDIAPTILS